MNEDILCNFNEAESGGVDKVDFDAVINKSPLTVNFNTSLEYVLIFLQSWVHDTYLWRKKVV